MNRLRTHSPTKAQAMLEFALALPVLLLLLFGIMEFGRLVQAWLAVQNSARFGVRYAITGELDPGYCELAATTFGYEAADTFGTSPAEYDCHVAARLLPILALRMNRRIATPASLLLSWKIGRACLLFANRREPGWLVLLLLMITLSLEITLVT